LPSCKTTRRTPALMNQPKGMGRLSNGRAGNHVASSDMITQQSPYGEARVGALLKELARADAPNPSGANQYQVVSERGTQPARLMPKH
jgi:hypothetical protein